MNRWRVVVGGVSMNLALGSLYAWSVFVLPLEQEFGWTRAQTSWTFTIAIVTFAAAGAPAHAADAQEKIRDNCKAMTIPMLLTSSEKDPFGGADNIRQWSKGLSHVSSKTVPGADHGMAIYYDVRKDVVAFIKKHIAPSIPRARPVSGRGRSR